MRICDMLIDRQARVLLDFSLKAGSTSVCRMFFANLGLLELALEYNPWIHAYRVDRYYQEYGRCEVCEYLDESFFRFKVVRNPFARAVSSYFAFCEICLRGWRGLEVRPFADFLAGIESGQIPWNPHWAPQFEAREAEYPNLQFLIVNIENSEQDIAAINRERGTRFPSLKRKLRHHRQHMQDASFDKFVGFSMPPFDIAPGTLTPPYRCFYNEDLRQSVLRIYQDDFRAYGYSDRLDSI